MPIVYGRRNAFRTAYRMAGYPSSSGYSRGRRRVAYLKRNSLNRRVMRSARRMDTAMAFRGWVPGGVIEKKAIDTTITSTAVSTTAVITPINLCSQGTAVNNRVGSKILVRSINIRGAVLADLASALTASNNAPPQTVRMVVYVDKQPNGATITATDLLETASVFSPIALANRDRFLILKDKYFNIGAVNVPATANTAYYGGQPQQHVFKWFKKCRIPVTYGTNAGTIADIKTNAIGVFLYGGAASGVADAAASMYVRVRFSDA